MKVTWLGHSMFLIENDEGVRIITDPYHEYTGYSPPKISADIVTVSHQHKDHANISIVEDSPKIIDSIGNYNIKGVTIEGISSYHDEVKGKKRGNNIIFKFNIDDVTLVHMGDYGEPTLSKEQVDALKGVDVLLIPVGDRYTIDGVQAAEVVHRLEPRVAVPMHYKTRVSVFDISTEEPFLEKMPKAKNIGRTIELTASSLPKETEVWVMEYSS